MIYTIIYYTLHILLLTALVFFWKKKLKNTPFEAYFYPALAVKMLACVGYGVVYYRLYKGEGDTFNYYRDVATLVQLFYDQPQNYIKLLFGQYYSPDIHFTNDLIWRETRMFVFVKICSIFQILIGNDYRMMAIYMSLLSFSGVWFLCQKLLLMFPTRKMEIAVAFLFLPSALMWSSGYSKESIVMWAFGVVIGKSIELFLGKKYHFWGYIWLILALGSGLFVLFLIKFYYVASLVPALLASLITYTLALQPTKGQEMPLFGFKKVFLKNFIFIPTLYVFIFGLLVLPLMYFYPAFWFQNLMFNIVYNHNSMYLQSAPEDLIHYSTRFGRGYINLDVSMWNILYNSPNAFFSIVLRPFVWETGGNKLKLLAGVENFLLLLGIFEGIFYYFFIKNINPEVETEKKIIPMHQIMFIVAIGVFVVVLYVLLALASPNLGSLSRYRVVGHSWVWFGVLCWISPYFLKVKNL